MIGLNTFLSGVKNGLGSRDIVEVTGSQRAMSSIGDDVGNVGSFDLPRTIRHVSIFCAVRPRAASKSELSCGAVWLTLSRSFITSSSDDCRTRSLSLSPSYLSEVSVTHVMVAPRPARTVMIVSGQIQAV